MQKKIIALAIAAAISAPAFADNANFSFYGTADISSDFVSTGDGVTTANGATKVYGTNKRVVSSNVSKFGFKGSEDLGNGLSAIWQIEQQIDLDAASKNTFASRNTFAGLKSDYGTVLMGIHDTPYKISTRKLDVFGDNIADNRALMGAPKSSTTGAGFTGASSQGFELRPTDVIAYISPAISGVTIAAAAVNLSETNTAGSSKSNGALSLAAMYDVAPFYASAAYESHTLDAAAGDSQNESATRVGFGFKPEGFELNVVYEKTTDNLGTAKADKYGHSTYYVAGKYHIGQDDVKLAYTSAGELNSSNVANSNTSAAQVSLGYDFGMTKRTKLYALYTVITNGKGINYGFSQNSGASYTSSGFGTTPTALSLGMKHSF